MITDLVQIKRIAKTNEDEDCRLRRWMKDRDYDDAQWRQVAAGIQERIDCRACANCCRISGTIVNEEDVERLAAHLSISVSEFRERYVERGEFGDDELTMPGDACMFLVSNAFFGLRNPA